MVSYDSQTDSNSVILAYNFSITITEVSKSMVLQWCFWYCLLVTSKQFSEWEPNTNSFLNLKLSIKFHFNVSKVTLSCVTAQQSTATRHLPKKHNTKHLICRQQSAEGKRGTRLPSSDAMLQIKPSKSEICAVESRAPRNVNQNTWMQ